MTEKQTLIQNLSDKIEETPIVKIDDNLEDINKYLMDGSVDINIRISKWILM